ncbi:MAG: hypothetical protein K6G22_00915 [Lachnospiraceae bacterium]|nr:hypothetical protein [Lachnospiraceae bacterium]
MIDRKTKYEYADLIDKDVAEDLVRKCYRGMTVRDSSSDDLLSLLIWELKSAEYSDDAEAELKWIYAEDPSSIYPLPEGYHREALNDKVRRTFFESGSLGKDKQQALDQCGFSLRKTESRDIHVTVDECKALSIAKKNAPPYVKSME